MSTFSYNLLADGLAFQAGLWVGCAGVVLLFLAVGVATAGWVRRAAMLGRLPVTLRDAGYKLLMFALGVGVAFILIVNLRPFGKISNIAIVGEGHEQFALVGFAQHRGGKASRTVHSRRTFSLPDGAEIGSLDEGPGRFSGRLHTAHADGGIRVTSAGDSYEVFGTRELRPLGNLNAAVESRVTTAFRIDAVVDRAVTVDLADGRRETFELGALMPGLPMPRPVRNLRGPGACRATSGSGDRVGELLRAATVVGEACRYDLPSASVELVLHRSTAFGEGEHLLSALGPDGAVWTTPLGPLVNGVDELEILEPSMLTPSRLQVWLVRDNLSLSSVVLSAGTGEVTDMVVVF